MTWGPSRLRRISASLPAAGLAAIVLAALPVRAAPADGHEGLADWRRQALDLVNKDRADHHLPALTSGAALETAAQNHAEDMLKRDYYAHTSPEGDDVQDRFTAAGGRRWRLIEENIARCAACRPPLTADDIRRLETGWMNSPHHRENILREGLDSFGYGIVADEEQGVYAVQTFAGPGTPRGLAEDQAPQALAKDELASRMADLLNARRKKAGAPPLAANDDLSEGAEALMPAPSSQSTGLRHGGDLLGAMPAQSRTQWRSLQVVSGACGGCGAEATLADLKFFRGQWLDSPQYADLVLGTDVTDMGFGLQVDGNGRKVAVLVLATRR